MRNSKTIMKKSNISVTLEKAREWYNSGNTALQEVALQAFNKNELEHDFRNIKTLEDACNVLGLDYFNISCKATNIANISKASAAMFKVNIIRKALHIGQSLSLINNPRNSNIYYPYNPFITKNATLYDEEMKINGMGVIGAIKSEGALYYVLGGDANAGGSAGLGYFYSSSGVGAAEASTGFLGCANEEIARHFGKYFGMLITEAKFGDIEDFEIIDVRY